MIRSSVWAICASRSEGIRRLTWSAIRCSITAIEAGLLHWSYHGHVGRTRACGGELWAEMVEEGQLMGIALAHPNGGPPLALRLDPERALSAAGFDYFAIGVPDKEAIDELASRLTSQG